MQSFKTARSSSQNLLNTGQAFGRWQTTSPAKQLGLAKLNIGALIVTYTILGVPYYNYRIMGPCSTEPKLAQTLTLVLNPGPT